MSVAKFAERLSVDECAPAPANADAQTTTARFIMHRFIALLILVSIAPQREVLVCPYHRALSSRPPGVEGEYRPTVRDIEKVCTSGDFVHV